MRASEGKAIRGGAIAVIAVLVFLMQPVPAVAPHIGGSRLDPVLILQGCPPGATGDCTMAAWSLNRTLLFFRFDLNNDGKFDYPDQTGGGSIGIWTTEATVTRRYAEPSRGACVQGWDGVSFGNDGGEFRAVGPTGCNTFADFLPPQWSRQSGGSVWVRFDIPLWLDPSDFGRRAAEVEGLRAIPWPFRDYPGERDPHVWYFRVDRASLTAVLGPGMHTVHLTLTWAERTFTVAGEATIL